MKKNLDTLGWRFWLLLAVLLVGGVVINHWQRIGEAHVARLQLQTFPTSIGQWQQLGVDERFDKETESVLRADDYLSRIYVLPNGRVASFYVGYYASQRSGATYHSPLNCLPGSGWTMEVPSRVTIKPVNGGAPFEANRYIIRKGPNKQLLLYWYQGRGRAVASEYWGKVYTVLDSVRRHRSDGAMVRVMTPINRSEAEAAETATALAAQIWPELAPYIPE